jgi:hypothetical protein
MENNMIVRNATDTSDDRPSKGDEDNIDHWNYHNGSDAGKCSYIACFERQDLVGAHVEIVGDKSGKMYIIPLCRKHNGQHEGEIPIPDEIYLMPAEYLKKPLP